MCTHLGPRGLVQQSGRLWLLEHEVAPSIKLEHSHLAAESSVRRGQAVRPEPRVVVHHLVEPCEWTEWGAHGRQYNHQGLGLEDVRDHLVLHLWVVEVNVRDYVKIAS